eukprot:scaffold19288_cov79-Skeletonema_dohrnii-CCMP3373.AAC.3
MSEPTEPASWQADGYFYRTSVPFVPAGELDQSRTFDVLLRVIDLQRFTFNGLIIRSGEGMCRPPSQAISNVTAQ